MHFLSPASVEHLVVSLQVRRVSFDARAASPQRHSEVNSSRGPGASGISEPATLQWLCKGGPLALSRLNLVAMLSAVLVNVAVAVQQRRGPQLQIC